MLIIQNVNRNTPLAQTACDPESWVLAPNDESSDGVLFQFHRKGRAVSRSPKCYRRTVLFRLTCEASSREANSVPATKYRSGPKLRAAVAPTKWSPGTEEQKPPVT